MKLHVEDLTSVCLRYWFLFCYFDGYNRKNGRKVTPQDEPKRINR